jgi:hypothetical protein
MPEAECVSRASWTLTPALFHALTPPADNISSRAGILALPPPPHTPEGWPKKNIEKSCQPATITFRNRAIVSPVCGAPTLPVQRHTVPAIFDNPLNHRHLPQERPPVLAPLLSQKGGKTTAIFAKFAKFTRRNNRPSRQTAVSTVLIRACHARHCLGSVAPSD